MIQTKQRTAPSRLLSLLIFLGVAGVWGWSAWADDSTETPDAATAQGPNPLVAIRVYPNAIHLTNGRDRQSLVVQAEWQNGVTQDVTEDSQFELIGNAATISAAMLVPASDGQASLRVQYAGQAAEVPITVSNVATHPPISFQLDVMPVFMKAGCNAGSCHGAARGKDGFRLSLYGFDPAGDYHRLTREQPGRRIDVGLPEQCLLVEKAVGEVSHSGGKLMDRESEHYQTLVQWLRAGAGNDPGEVPKVTQLEIYPAESVLDGAGATQQMTVRAQYSDGSDRDVTNLAYFMTNNGTSAAVDQGGKVTAGKRGEAFVSARFETHTVGVPVIVLPKDLDFQWDPVEEKNYIDTLVHAKLKKLRIQPSELCSDHEFVRRVYVDICGVVPTVEETVAFLADESEDKRARLIDELLDRKEFVDVWVMKWSELLQVRSNNRVSYKATLMYYTWLQQQIANNVPIDQMVKNLLGSEGGVFSNAATNYYQNEQDTLKIAENVAQVFMGMRIQCAQCHNHPFDRWTMDDYYGFAAFFSQIGRKRGVDPRETIVFDRRSGDVKHPVGGRVMAPKFLGGATPEVRGKDRRLVLADWLVSAENPYFARNLANMVWAHFLGRGIIHEVDDVRVSNPPANGPLLDELGRRFGEYKYDFKSLVRDICNSRTYQLSTRTNATNQGDGTNFSHALLRRIKAENLLDIVSQVTGTQDKFRGLPLGARAVQIADGTTSNYFLTTFGRAKRDTVCSCEVKMEPSLSQALHLINGDTVQAKIQQGGLVKSRVEAGKPDEDVVNEIYLRAFCRKPTEEEWAKIQTLLAENENRQQGLEDIFWAVLNSREFVFNH